MRKKRLPKLRSDKEAEDFVAVSNLTQFDLSAMRSVRFEFGAKRKRSSPETDVTKPLSSANIHACVPRQLAQEQFRDLLAVQNVRIERIVSTGQATPAGEWLDQGQSEWVILLRGAARLRFAGEAKPRILKPGDYVNIPAHCRHRVDWTTPREPTVWLAVHYAA